MPISRFILLYIGILLPVMLLYIFSILVPAFSSAPMPDLHAATPFLLDLIKVIVGGAIGAFSTIVASK